MRTTEQVATDVLRCALGHDPDARLVGNVTAVEMASLAAQHITACPDCGSEPWVNIDCDLCVVATLLEKFREKERNKSSE